MVMNKIGSPARMNLAPKEVHLEKAHRHKLVFLTHYNLEVCDDIISRLFSMISMLNHLGSFSENLIRFGRRLSFRLNLCIYPSQHKDVIKT